MEEIKGKAVNKYNTFLKGYKKWTDSNIVEKTSLCIQYLKDLYNKITKTEMGDSVLPTLLKFLMEQVSF